MARDLYAETLSATRDARLPTCCVSDTCLRDREVGCSHRPDNRLWMGYMRARTYRRGWREAGEVHGGRRCARRR